MRIAPAIILRAEQRAALEQRAKSRSLPARVVERASIVLLAADGQQDKEIAASLRMTPKKVSRWRKRFLTLGMAGLERDAPRPGRTPKINAGLIGRVVNLTTREKPPNATHWSTRSMARTVGISEASVRRIWHSHGLKPHRVETFKVSNDPEFAEKLRDIVGLYLNPPEHAMVLCVDEKSQIQALDRTQPGLPLKRGRSGAITRIGGLLSGPLPLALRLAAAFAGRRRSRQLRKAAAVSSIAGSLLTRVAWLQAGHASAKNWRLPLED